MPEKLRPATLQEKEAWLSNVSKGFTRGLFHGVPIEQLPLYYNGDDFYIIPGAEHEAPKEN